MSASLHIPLAVIAKTPQELSKAILKVQAELGGKVSIVSIYWDGTNHVCWYLPLRNLGGGLV